MAFQDLSENVMAFVESFSVHRVFIVKNIFNRAFVLFCFDLFCLRLCSLFYFVSNVRSDADVVENFFC